MDRSNRLYVYDNWSAYDELSDSIPLTEELAMLQFDHMLRLRRLGVAMDAYLMDAFWYDRDSGYRAWKKDRWPQGPDRWLGACADHGILPGLWFPTNTTFDHDPPPAWRDSLASDGWGYCCFEGGFLSGFVEAMEHWYGRGVRVFKFDFADFAAATEKTRLKMLPSEIRVRNVDAFREAMVGFKSRNSEAVLLAYNGFEEAEFMTWTDRPIRRLIDPRWLDAFESVYSGDPRPADVPLPDFWRTLDTYADQMVRFCFEGGLPLDRIDNCSFMIGVAGTCYGRGNAGWKTCLILSLARGGRVHMTLGNLDKLSNADAKFFAAAQALFCDPAAATGGVPGRAEPYGYRTRRIATLVNPSLESHIVAGVAGHSLTFTDGNVRLLGDRVELGPGAVAVLTQDPVATFEGASLSGLPERLVPIPCEWQIDRRSALGTIAAQSGRDLHLLFEQRDGKGMAVRTSPGISASGKSNREFMRIEATAGGLELPMVRVDDRVIWSGISWAYGVVRAGDLPQSGTIEVRMETLDPAAATILPRAYAETPAPLFEREGN